MELYIDKIIEDPPQAKAIMDNVNKKSKLNQIKLKDWIINVQYLHLYKSRLASVDIFFRSSGTK